MTDSRDAMCGIREQKWTKEPPTEIGYYWIRNIEYAHIPDNSIVEVYRSSNSLYVMVMGNDIDFKASGVYAEWYGPILPPPD